MSRIVPFLLIASCFNPQGQTTTSTGTLGPGSSGSSTGAEPTSSSSTGSSTSTEDSSTSSGSSGVMSGTTSPEMPTTGTPTTGSTTERPDPVCGNGVVEPGEPCDDGNGAEGDGCTPLCAKDALFVFVTSTIRSPNFGEVEEADAFCQARAAEGIVPPATYIAWVSLEGQSALARMKDNPTLPYVRPDLLPVAEKLIDLLDTTLSNPIDVTEFGEVLAPGEDCRSDALAWTGTQANGMSAALTCEDWTTTDAASQGISGLVHMTNGSWSADCSTPCNRTLHIYCIEQP